MFLQSLMMLGKSGNKQNYSSIEQSYHEKIFDNFRTFSLTHYQIYM